VSIDRYVDKPSNLHGRLTFIDGVWPLHQRSRQKRIDSIGRDVFLQLRDECISVMTIFQSEISLVLVFESVLRATNSHGCSPVYVFVNASILSPSSHSARQEINLEYLRH
jgi:hypothetical protein